MTEVFISASIVATVLIIDQDFYNTDGNGMILIVEREDHCFGEAASTAGDYIGTPHDFAILSGAEWLESPNDVIEAWYRKFHDHGQLIRPNTALAPPTSSPA